MTPIDLIARSIQRERAKAHMSLSALAKEAGLAKSTLSQLEAGQGNPSVETLWAIANALNVPFSFLFETASPDKTLIRSGEGEPVSSESASFCATLLSNCPPGRRRDLYRTNLSGGSIRKAEAHPAGTVEHVFVAQGQVRVGPLNELETLDAGDYYRFPGDVAHSYEALTDKATVLLVMESVM
ncbi:helix-turn-helix domain-containing protein [Labrenzia sp. PHM005]|uniref:helix-turn-helix domain-containing protein n=1 Tax=Labrenzia sp. PHM005 TaxID=2590016 RepID=UPI0011401D83|nr:XRE family transcriptional regulator [Labrenzia sp. PHM005]QDG78759.1 helix-turn-helix domain-containing protein [Labrenzia sp. PHM005]